MMAPCFSSRTVTGWMRAPVEGMEHVHGIRHPEDVRHLMRVQGRRDQRAGGPLHRAPPFIRV